MASPMFDVPDKCGQSFGHDLAFHEAIRIADEMHKILVNHISHGWYDDADIAVLEQYALIRKEVE